MTEETKNDQVKDEDNQNPEGTEPGGVATLEGEEPKEEDTGVQIVREGQNKDGKEQSVFSKRVGDRVNRLNKKAANQKERGDTEQQRADQLQAKLDIAEERNKLNQIALEQAKSGGVQEKGMPNPDDFDAGSIDPAYLERKQAHDREEIAKLVDDRIADYEKATQQKKSHNEIERTFKSKQDAHYERADKLGARDYDETEKEAINLLGTEFVRDVISNFNDSETMLYWFGKNPDEAHRIKETFKANPVLGISELGVIRKDLKIIPSTETLPNPDEELKGSSSTATGTANSIKLDRLREQAVKTGDMKELLAFKKTLREAG